MADLITTKSPSPETPQEHSLHANVLGATVDLIGLGTLALGLIPMAWYWSRGSTYFSRRPLNVEVQRTPHPSSTV